jgi:hypothetical protein
MVTWKFEQKMEAPDSFVSHRLRFLKYTWLYFPLCWTHKGILNMYGSLLTRKYKTMLKVQHKVCMAIYYIVSPSFHVFLNTSCGQSTRPKIRDEFF